MNNTTSKEERYVKQFVQEGLNRKGYVFELGGRIVGNITGSDICDLIIEYAKQESRREAIEFKKWVDLRNRFLLDEIGKLPTFIDYKTDEELYEQYIIHKQNNQ